MVQTLIDVLRRATPISHKGFTFLDDHLEAEDWTFAALAEEADRRARYFLSLGLTQGDRLAMVIPDGKDFVLSFLGAIRAGIVPVPMYPPLALGKLDSFIDAATRILRTSGARMLLTTRRVAPVLWSLVSRAPDLEDILLTHKISEHDDPGPQSIPLDGIEITADDPCFLQFTSGSTSDPKGVVVSHGNLVANAHAIMVDGLGSDPEQDRGVSWLPLYHDMGLIGFVVAPLYAHVPVVFLPTLTFVKRPATWLETVSRYRGTITFAPNFAFGLAAKRATPQRVAGLDLSSLRVVGCGAEPINPATLRQFIERYAPAGLNENAVMPCYGMAEATLAIAFDDLSRPFSAVRLSRERYEDEHRAARSSGGEDDLELVSCGKTFPGHEVAILADDGRPLPEGTVGEIAFRGPSVTRGYHDNPEATRDLHQDGWLKSGDLGFLLDEELYISGRKKDLVILNGRNYHPQSIEWEVERVEGIRRGNTVAFSTRGENTEALVIVAETPRLADREALAEEVKNHLQATLGVVAHDVALVDRGRLPKTSSGKLQRKRTKAEYESGALGLENRLQGAAGNRLVLMRHVLLSALARLAHWLRKTGRPARKLASSVLREHPAD